MHNIEWFVDFYALFMYCDELNNTYIYVSDHSTYLPSNSYWDSTCIIPLCVYYILPLKICTKTYWSTYKSTLQLKCSWQSFYLIYLDQFETHYIEHVYIIQNLALLYIIFFKRRELYKIIWQNEGVKSQRRRPSVKHTFMKRWMLRRWFNFYQLHYSPWQICTFIVHPISI